MICKPFHRTLDINPGIIAMLVMWIQALVGNGMQAEIGGVEAGRTACKVGPCGFVCWCLLVGNPSNYTDMGVSQVPSNHPSHLTILLLQPVTLGSTIFRNCHICSHPGVDVMCKYLWRAYSIVYFRMHWALDTKSDSARKQFFCVLPNRHIMSFGFEELEGYVFFA